MLAYVLWLMLPAVQTLGGAITGGLCILFFGIGVLLDVETLRREWLHLLVRAACAALLPLFLIRFLSRGGAVSFGFYVQNVMFWFPLVFVGHVRTIGDRTLWKGLSHTLVAACMVTLCTTTGWLIEGMLNNANSYCRALGNADAVSAEYLASLMRRNIGGYGFIYSMVLSIPLVCASIRSCKGKKRMLFCVFLALQIICIVLSQYTIALICTAFLLFVEFFAMLLRRLTRKRISYGKALAISMLFTLPLIVSVKQLLALVISISDRFQFHFVTDNLTQVLAALQGDAVSSGNRLIQYMTAVDGIRMSPLTGSLFTEHNFISFHSDILDLISATGILGLIGFGFAVWLTARGSLRGLRSNLHRRQLALCYAALFAVSLLGTVVYSCEISLVVLLGTLILLQPHEQPVERQE